jgi:hypothetical protein
MIRTVIVLALLLSAAVMIHGVASDWRKNPISPPVEAPAKKGAVPGNTLPLPQARGVQPALPGVMPDLKEGYLFNQERMLANAEAPSAQEGNAEMDASQGVRVSIDQVTYVGSIITKKFSRAIVVYPAANNAAQPTTPFFSRSSSKPPAATEDHAQLEVGEMLGGYKVTEILPDKLILSKGDEKVEKLLYEPGKKRKAPPPPVKTATAGGGAPASAENRAITIREVTAPPVGVPGMANSPSATSLPASPNNSAPAVRPLPLRRRSYFQPPPASSDTGGQTSLPLGGNTNDAPAIPPTPGGR